MPRKVLTASGGAPLSAGLPTFEFTLHVIFNRASYCTAQRRSTIKLVAEPTYVLAQAGFGAPLWKFNRLGVVNPDSA